MRATWNGLTVTALEYVTSPDSEYTEVQLHRIVFQEPGSQTGPVLARLGFGVSRVGQTRETYEPAVMMDPKYVSLKQHGNGSALECY